MNGMEITLPIKKEVVEDSQWGSCLIEVNDEMIVYNDSENLDIVNIRMDGTTYCINRNQLSNILDVLKMEVEDGRNCNN